AHKDSLGNGSVIRPGDVQRMSAGTGVTHSEFNHSNDELVHFLQIWILPERAGARPSYAEKRFDEAEKRGRLKLIGSRDGRDGSVVRHHVVARYASVLDNGEEVEHTLADGRSAWLQVARGAVQLNGEELRAGDGAAVTDEPTLTIRGAGPAAEILLFDLPP